jgi:hypothetical protein
LEIIFVHHILSIYLRHLFTMVCILRWISFVTSQVSHPYNNTLYSKTSDKINGRSKSGNLLQINIQGTENSHHSFTIRFGSDTLFKKTPAVCRAKLKHSHSVHEGRWISTSSYTRLTYIREVQ